MSPEKFRRLILVILGLLLSSSCSFFEAEKSPPKHIAPSLEATEQAAQKIEPPYGTKVSVEGSTRTTNDSPDDIQVLWAIPEEPVDAFMIRYGYSAENLKFNVKLTPNELLPYESKDLGKVYRYVIRGIQHGQKIYVGMQSVKGEKVSAMSSILAAGTE